MRIYLALFTLILISFTASAETSSQLIASNCFSCHGDKLKYLDISRPLSAKKLSKTLLAFRDNKKRSTIMNRITKGFSKAELKAVTSFISATQ